MRSALSGAQSCRCNHSCPPRHASGTCVVIAYHVLLKSEPYRELDGAYFIERHQKEADQRRLVKQLESMGYDVALMEKAA